ncbi:hypothetical protein IMZ11_02430 [Microtetraspora sp. AC03309]|uniref:hypothetical protein n=1 Tax=Microtetraspora sp. AC03309 TaxID=2779376 RepID=UPI001E4E51F3|nr:hypothetical protein [Microtetraspora sp. AC03309]MCC5574497.1 hypothetical protein [Microtetraspora sp. AC03309]
MLGLSACSSWHQCPRPMLRALRGETTARQQPAEPRKPVLVLCDDGRWHAGLIQAWHQREDRWDCLLDYYSGRHHYEAWYAYSPVAIRHVPDDWWREPERWETAL